MNPQLLMAQGATVEEISTVQNCISGMSPTQEQQFYMLYLNKRKDQQTMLLLCLLGFVGFAGIHRLVTNDIALGILYLVTAGLCFIGTIIDLINIGSLTSEYNRKQAMETAQMVRMMVK